jgi:hypothetical protein
VREGGRVVHRLRKIVRKREGEKARWKVIYRVIEMKSKI